MRHFVLKMTEVIFLTFVQQYMSFCYIISDFEGIFDTTKTRPFCSFFFVPQSYFIETSWLIPKYCDLTNHQVSIGCSSWTPRNINFYGFKKSSSSSSYQNPTVSPLYFFLSFCSARLRKKIIFEVLHILPGQNDKISWFFEVFTSK